MSLRVVTVFPTANPERAATAISRWHARGYEVHVWTEGHACDGCGADYLHRADKYPGYFVAANALAHHAVNHGADFVVVIGDDMDPDPAQTPAEIGQAHRDRFPDGYGVMNPIGDHLAGTDQTCGCPWLGRGWVKRAYGGRGPYWPGYGHFFGDTELQLVAQRQGVLWQRDDVAQFHHHWSRIHAGEPAPPVQPYQRASIDRWWAADRELFAARQRDGFPGTEPL